MNESDDADLPNPVWNDEDSAKVCEISKVLMYFLKTSWLMTIAVYYINKAMDMVVMKRNTS